MSNTFASFDLCGPDRKSWLGLCCCCSSSRSCIVSKKAGHRCLELKKNARNSKEQKLCAIKWGMFTDSQCGWSVSTCYTWYEETWLALIDRNYILLGWKFSCGTFCCFSRKRIALGFVWRRITFLEPKFLIKVFQSGFVQSYRKLLFFNF